MHIYAHWDTLASRQTKIERKKEDWNTSYNDLFIDLYA